METNKSQVRICTKSRTCGAVSHYGDCASMPSTPVMSIPEGINSVYVVERRKHTRRADYNAFKWTPVFTFINIRTAQASMRESRNTTSSYEYRIKRYVALPDRKSW
jgi:hypothetical protein